MRVLHVGYTYKPDPIGGTEVFIAALARELAKLGVSSAIAAPGHRSLGSDGTIPIFRFPIGRVTDASYGAPDEGAADGFAQIVKKWRPDVVHLHARTSAVSEMLFDEARAAVARTIFTYHTPTVSCVRGTMMYLNRTTCKGVLDVSRCTSCVLQQHGVGWPANKIIALAPERLGRVVGSAGLDSGAWIALRMRQLVADNHRRFYDFLSKAERVVAVCDWVADVLRENGLSEPKLFLSRQGLPVSGKIKTEARDDGRGNQQIREQPLRLAFFGRLDATKGVDVLLRAVRAVRSDLLKLDIFGVVQQGTEAYAESLKQLASNDRRISFHQPVPVEQVISVMQGFDLVAVPSTWLETGPLVVLEAFAAGRPVLGSRLGGIAELVKDGTDGILLPPADERAWTQAIEGLVHSPKLVTKLCAGVVPPRTIADCAADHVKLYADLLEQPKRAA